MTNEPMLSVLVITYNQEKYISKTLDSILEQEHDYSYEIVIGEDCSTDDTKQIIESYAERYPEIIKPFYNNPNKGLIKNYFETIAHCKGKYIMDVAGDDWWLPGKVKKQIEFMEANSDVGMCYGRAKQFFEEKKRIVFKKYGTKKTTFQELIQKNDIPAPTICLRRDVFEQYIKDVNPIEKNWVMEDYPMWLWFSKYSKISFLNDCLAVYRILNNSVSHFEVIDDRVTDFLKSHIEVNKYFADDDSFFKDYDIHREVAWKMAINKKVPRNQVIEELKKVKVQSAEDKRLLRIYKYPLLFWLMRFRWNLMGLK